MCNVKCILILLGHSLHLEFSTALNVKFVNYIYVGEFIHCCLGNTGC